MPIICGAGKFHCSLTDESEFRQAQSCGDFGAFRLQRSQLYKHEAAASESFAALETHSLALRACISVPESSSFYRTLRSQVPHIGRGRVCGFRA